MRHRAGSLLGRIYNWQVPLEREALEIVADLAHVQPGERVLDVATGTGAVLRQLTVHGAEGAQIIGLDRSLAMLSALCRVPSPRQIVVADARELPFGDATFDVITMAFLLHLRPSEGVGVLAASHRALRSGGRLVTVTVDSPHVVVRWVLGALPAWTGLRPLDPRRTMARVGFHPVRDRYARAGWPSLCVLARRD